MIEPDLRAAHAVADRTDSTSATVVLSHAIRIVQATAAPAGGIASSLARTQQQAMMTSMYLLMVPFIYLSGLIFPIENMPKVIQWGTYLVPVRYYAVILRGVFLKGVGLETLWPEALALLGSGLLVLALAALRFRKSLD